MTQCKIQSYSIASSCTDIRYLPLSKQHSVLSCALEVDSVAAGVIPLQSFCYECVKEVFMSLFSEVFFPAGSLMWHRRFSDTFSQCRGPPKELFSVWEALLQKTCQSLCLRIWNSLKGSAGVSYLSHPFFSILAREIQLRLVTSQLLTFSVRKTSHLAADIRMSRKGRSILTSVLSKRFIKKG